jgi:prevent-host-death family protein
MHVFRISDSLVPLSKFKAHAVEFLDHASKTGYPIVLTRNGRAAGVLLSPKAYDELAEASRFLAAVNEGLADAEHGRYVPHEVVKAESLSRPSRKGRK